MKFESVDWYDDATKLLLLVKMFIEIFPFIYIQYDLLERLQRKHYYPLFALYIDKVIHQSSRVGILPVNPYFFFFKWQEGLKTMISWRIIPSNKYYFKNPSIRKKRKCTGIPCFVHI
jgi:hypothetical protein